MGGVGGWSTRSLMMSTTLVSSAVGMAAGLLQMGVVTELGLDASVVVERKKIDQQLPKICHLSCKKRLLSFLPKSLTTLLTQRACGDSRLQRL